MQLPTGHLGVSVVPQIIADCSPDSGSADLDGSFMGSGVVIVDKSDISIGASCDLRGVQ